MPSLSEKISPYWGFARFVLARFKEDRGPQVAASLTYTTLLSLVPIITIALTVISAFPVFDELMAHLKVFLLTTLMPQSAGKIITVYMQQFSEKAARLTLVGIAFLGVTAYLLLHTIELAFNTIWRVRKPRPWLERVAIFWALLILGPLLLGGSLTLTSYLVGLSFGWVGHLPAMEVAVLKMVQGVLAVSAFSMLYLLVPYRYVPFSHAVAGGALAGALFEAMKLGFAFYVTQFPTYKLVYGAFAAIPIFLLWIYLSWLVVLAGAEVTATLAYWQGGVWRIKETPGRRFFDALRLLQALYSVQPAGGAVSLRQLRQRVPLAYEDMEEVLERLGDIGLAQRLAGGDWAAGRNWAEVKVSEIHRCFVITQEGAVADGLPPAVQALGRQWDAMTDVSLHQLFTAGEGVASP